MAAGRALALLRGRTYVLPQDVFDVAPDILRHRIVLSYEALARDVGVDDVLARLLSTVPAPRVAVQPRAPLDCGHSFAADGGDDTREIGSTFARGARDQQRDHRRRPAPPRHPLAG